MILEWGIRAASDVDKFMNNIANDLSTLVNTGKYITSYEVSLLKKVYVITKPPTLFFLRKISL